MKVKELYKISPQSFVFIRKDDGSVVEYCGGKEYADDEVKQITATDYPMFASVLEIKV